jgi:hypothetical protein
VDAAGVVSPVALASEVGGEVVFEAPWGAGSAPAVTDGAGAAVPVTAVSPGVFSFPTLAGGAYTIAAGAALQGL